MNTIGILRKSYVLFLLVFYFSSEAAAGENRSSFSLREISPQLEVHGFYEIRSGYRLREDPYEKDISVMETRLQMECSTYSDLFEFKYKGDVWGDQITEKGDYDTREAWIFSRPSDHMDIKIGRQILTWGTGDLVFLNDLFPKDWQSFFIGRDMEYLKAPSDAVKLSFFPGPVSIDLVYTPQFDADRYVTGDYLSYWSSSQQRIAGKDHILYADKPDKWFTDDEMAARVYKNINNYEYALYGYWGFWKTPAGETAEGVKTFQKLNVYGASVRGNIGRGIGNIEIAYYDSLDDRSGENPSAENPQMRYLIGYKQDIAKDFNVSVQYYVEQILYYGNYKRYLTSGPAEDQYRQVITVELTKLLMNQNLRISFPMYYSPTDNDAYLRPIINYKYNDHVNFEIGANIFLQENPYSFFGQFDKNTNIYVSLRYSF